MGLSHMNIVISVSGNGSEPLFDPRFGRAAAFCLVNTETGDRKVYENPAFSAAGGAGVKAAQFISSLGAQVVISGAYGPNAFRTLSPARIGMYLVPGNEVLSVSDVLAQFNTGKLDRAESATHAGYHGS